MCGIVGYIGKESAIKTIFSGLKSLEYRGYDSAGIALQNQTGEIEVIKEKGVLSNLIKKVEFNKVKDENCGIGHTRWATHGEANEINAHPHFSDDKSVAIVHNGIIENYKELKSKLIKNGYAFYSDTDSEVLAKLIHYYLNKYGKPMDALARVCLRVVGSFAICALFKCDPEKIYCIRRDSPMVVGDFDGGVLIASDANAVASKTNKVVFVNNNEIVCATATDFKIFTIDQELKTNEYVTLGQKDKNGERGNYAHYMIKEIYEQDMVAKKVISYYTKGSELKNIKINQAEIMRAKQVNIIACGSAYNAALVGANEIEKISNLQTNVFLASEWKYKIDTSNKNDLFVFVSQSGETADTISCIRKAKGLGRKTIAIVNVFGSTLWREADVVLPVLAGAEIAVATTKAYLAQILVFHFLALKIANCKGILTKSRLKSCTLKTKRILSQFKNCFNLTKKLQRLAEMNFAKNPVLFLGRGIDYALCCEANLKLKEISYIHSEAYAAGELKHGSISLVENGTLCIGVITDSLLAKKTISNLVEVKSRGAKIIVFSSVGKKCLSGIADSVVCLPRSTQMLQPVLSIIPLQLFAYYVALARGLDIDKPRNLAKSVTVE